MPMVTRPAAAAPGTPCKSAECWPGRLKGNTMARSRHPNKEIEAAVVYAEAHGWTCTPAKGHAWGIIRCPHGQRGGCQRSVWSTPRNPTAHAEWIMHVVDGCPHPAQGGMNP